MVRAQTLRASSTVPVITATAVMVKAAKTSMSVRQVTTTATPTLFARTTKEASNVLANMGILAMV